MKAKKENSFEKKVKIALAEKGETQASLARKMGVTRAQINLWLKNKYTPKMSSLKKLADALDKPVNYFFENSGNIADNNSTISVNQNTDYRILTLEKELALLKKDLEIFKLIIEKKLAEEKKK